MQILAVNVLAVNRPLPLIYSVKNCLRDHEAAPRPVAARRGSCAERLARKVREAGAVPSSAGLRSG